MQMIRLPVMRLDWDEFTKKQNKTKKMATLIKKFLLTLYRRSRYGK